MHTIVTLSMSPLFIVVIALPVYAQSLSPLEEDQDGDGNPLNEEEGIVFNCFVDEGMVRSLARQFGIEQQVGTTLSEDDCNYVMHYLSGQCEEQTATGANVTAVCNTMLSGYLEDHDLLTKNFPTDREQFNTIMEEFDRQTAIEEQEKTTEEANTPSWTKDLETDEEN